MCGARRDHVFSPWSSVRIRRSTTLTPEVYCSQLGVWITVGPVVRMALMFSVIAGIASGGFWVRNKERALEAGEERTRVRKKTFLRLYLIVALQVTLSQNAFAYLDPATGSYVFQVLIAAIVGGLYTIKIYRKKIKDFFIDHFYKKK
jgi:hypothetical protein